MTDGVTRVASPTLPPVNEREVLRYMGVTGDADGEVLALLRSCMEESARVFTPRVCFREVLLRRCHKVQIRNREGLLSTYSHR